MGEIRIVATIKVKDSYKEEVLEACKRVVDGTRKESGVISYDLFQDIKDPLKYTILEIWKSEEAIQQHNETDHYKEFGAAIKEKVESLTVDVIRKIY